MCAVASFMQSGIGRIRTVDTPEVPRGLGREVGPPDTIHEPHGELANAIFIYISLWASPPEAGVNAPCGWTPCSGTRLDTCAFPAGEEKTLPECHETNLATEVRGVKGVALRVGRRSQGSLRPWCMVNGAPVAPHSDDLILLLPIERGIKGVWNTASFFRLLYMVHLHTNPDPNPN